jgi:hypothetical protein
MRHRIANWIMLLFIGLTSYHVNAFGDDEKQSNKKINVLQIGGKKTNKGYKSKKIDSLILTKFSEDTLTFDEKNHKDDTLIFADDEWSNNEGPNHELKDNNSSKNDGSNVILINPILYPNPSQGVSYIDLINGENTETEITVIGINGSIIRQLKTFENRYEINDLSTGTYLVIIKNSHQIVQKKLFVK